MKLLLPAACLSAVAILAWPGGMIMRKILSKLILPCGIVWLLLIGLVIMAWIRRDRRLLFGNALVLILYTLAGNAWLSGGLVWWLERDYVQSGPAGNEPFDAVIVLGGVTNTGPRGQAMLTSGGDRVMAGASLYHGGHTKRLVCTGQRIEGAGGSPRDAAEEVAELWRQIGIPQSDVIQLSGRTTSEEMSAIRRLLNEHHWQRVGLVTSAWHMRRALRLAAREELRLEPLPADFLFREHLWNGLSVIPDGGTLLQTQFAAKEMIALWLGQ